MSSAIRELELVEVLATRKTTTSDLTHKYGPMMRVNAERLVIELANHYQLSFISIKVRPALSV